MYTVHDALDMNVKVMIVPSILGIFSFYILICNLQTLNFQMIPFSQYRINNELDPKCQPMTQL